MIGFIEGCRHSSLTALEFSRNSDSFLKKAHSSIKTELVLQVSARMLLPNTTNFSCEKFRLLSNLIFSANNYWDIGLRAREQIFQNKDHQFVASMTILEETAKDMKKSLKEVTRQYPDMSELANTYISDGETLFNNRQNFSGTQYREIDSGISALFVFGVVGGSNCFEKTKLDLTKKCQSYQDLNEKYHLFMVNEIDISNLNNKSKILVGLQAIEMMIACLDDRWGIAEDTLLGIPNTMDNGLRANKSLLNDYKRKAIACGFSQSVIDILALSSHAHLIDSRKYNRLDPVELNDIQKHQNFGKIHFLREWLNNNSLLEELLR